MKKILIVIYMLMMFSRDVCSMVIDYILHYNKELRDKHENARDR